MDPGAADMEIAGCPQHGAWAGGAACDGAPTLGMISGARAIARRPSRIFAGLSNQGEQRRDFRSPMDGGNLPPTAPSTNDVL